MLKMAAKPLERLVGISEGTRVELAITYFLDGKPLKAERVGGCAAVAFYHGNGRVFGSLVHPIKGTNPDILFAMVRERITSLGTSVGLVGTSSSHLVSRLAELLELAGYGVRLRGFDVPALRDATLYPDGTLEVYRHDTKASESFSLGIFS